MGECRCFWTADRDGTEREPNPRCPLHGESTVPRSPQDRIDAALAVAPMGAFDGEHHKAWVIDQMVRALTGDGYDEWVRCIKEGEDGPETYGWDEGIAP